MIRYNIDENQQAMRDKVAEFSKKHIEPVSKELDHRDDPDRFAMDLYKKLGKAGFIGMRMPKEYGGGGVSALDHTTMIEEFCLRSSHLPAQRRGRAGHLPDLRFRQ
jgi:butyryl-CoA dehydrogenase